MITPQEAKTAQQEAIAPEIAAQEKRVDDALRANGVARTTVDMAGVSRPAVDRLVKLYREAGWSVTISHGSQIEPGLWIEFKPRVDPEDVPASWDR